MSDPDRLRAALAGLEAYQLAERPALADHPPAVATARGASLRDYGGAGPPLVVVPSLINSARILDLPDASLLRWFAERGHRALLVDWGPCAERADLDIAGHVRELLVPLIDAAGSGSRLLGYCLGGTMTMHAAALAPVIAVATLAAPWSFASYPDRDQIFGLWRAAEPSARQLGMLPIEALQAGFWSLDPDRTVQKYADFAAISPHSAEAARFVAIEDWLNGGEPLPLPAAVDLFGWFDRAPSFPEAPCPTLHIAATIDRIVPVETTSSAGERIALPLGHVGMIVGRQARSQVWEPLSDWLAER